MKAKAASTATIGKTLDMEADVVIDASGRLMIPGRIDPHAHMELPFGERSGFEPMAAAE